MKFKLLSKLICSLVLGFVASEAYGFPANTRLGYANCQSCHVAPTGGGALNAYGKSTANEIATWVPYEGEMEDSGASNFIVGADVRYLWTKVESPDFEYENDFLMQTDFELGATYKGFTVVGQFGQYYSQPEDVQASYRHYAMYQLKKHSLRVGKFAPVFGLNDPDHTLPGRNALGFDTRSASYNAEYVYTDRRWALNLTAIGGCQGGYVVDSDKDYCEDKGYAGYAARLMWSPNKIVTAGVSQAYLSQIEALEGEETEEKVLGAVDWVIGTKALYTLGEATVESNSLTEDLSYEGHADFMASPYRGVHAGYVLRLHKGSRKKYGVKAVWFPLAGLEFNFSWLREFSAKVNTDTFVLVGHAYL